MLDSSAVKETAATQGIDCDGKTVGLLYPLLLGVTPLKFHRHLLLQKTRAHGLSSGTVRVMIFLAGLIELRPVPVRQTDIQTHKHTDEHRPIAYSALG